MTLTVAQHDTRMFLQLSPLAHTPTAFTTPAKRATMVGRPAAERGEQPLGGVQQWFNAYWGR